MFWDPPVVSPSVRPALVFDVAETELEQEFDGAALAIPPVDAIPTPTTAAATAARPRTFFMTIPPRFRCVHRPSPGRCLIRDIAARRRDITTMSECAPIR
ncbi:hypothetical protein Acsp07_02720 [Actinomycetospora sp. NBRC 106378]|nr:hypothetical protein Acsp07_02720 [Actinomycetospora sp. NBRC 106378]